MSRRDGSAAAVVLQGAPASPGIAIGHAVVVRREMPMVPRFEVLPAEADSEVARLREAVERSREQLERIRGPVAHVEIVDAIFRAQVMILEDRRLFEDAAQRIRHSRVNAEWAVREELGRLEAVFLAMEDPYLRERLTDVRFAVRRLLLNLLGREPERLDGLQGPSIVIANDLSPAEAVQLDRSAVVGFVTEAGGRASHTAITAASLGIPALVGVEGATDAARDGDLVIVDGGTGRLLLRPAALDRERYEARARGQQAARRSLLRGADLPAETRDGRRVELLANIERSDEIPWIRRCGARGVGLFRTEFLFMDREALPDEEEQLAHYRAVLEGVAPDGAVIRTLDIGGDKLPAGMQRRLEANPALGLRGVRLCLADRGLLRTQLRALLRAGVHGRLRVLLPLVTGVEEVTAVREEIEDARAALEREGRPAAAGVELGVVVETPAAVAVADLLAREADFFSIGTNDLVQYTVAVDRENEHVAYLYDALHPAVLRQIRAVVEEGHRAGRTVAMCGEMAGDPLCSLVLVGLGLDELSMNAAALPRVKRIVRGASFEEARTLARDLLGLRSAAEVADRLRKEMLRRYPQEFPSAGDEG